GLSTLGARARALPDGLVIEGPTRWSGGHIDEHGDHRIALAFALTGLVSGTAVDIKEEAFVNVSWPEFWDTVAAARSGRG
ncbi:MAG TPA: 3-phosphoshikimate 1-carboxyvinyltransferase, partial [Actinomycetota bacterium]|nr:3-phosphoshikimate 1-carboxyvinyltransferase [Actinomycetota bacterium]